MDHYYLHPVYAECGVCEVYEVYAASANQKIGIKSRVLSKIMITDSNLLTIT